MPLLHPGPRQQRHAQMHGENENSNKEGGIIKFPQIISKPEPAKSTTTSNRIETVYGSDKVNELSSTKENLRTVLLSCEAMDDDTIVEALEKSPTYTREKTEAEHLRSLVKSISEGKGISLIEKEDTNSSEGQTISFA